MSYSPSLRWMTYPYSPFSARNSDRFSAKSKAIYTFLLGLEYWKMLEDLGVKTLYWTISHPERHRVYKPVIPPPYSHHQLDTPQLQSQHKSSFKKVNLKVNLKIMQYKSLIALLALIAGVTAQTGTSLSIP